MDADRHRAIRARSWRYRAAFGHRAERHIVHSICRPTVVDCLRDSRDPRSLGQADFFGTIQTALVSLGVFYVLGLVIGEAARRIVEENAKADLPSASARPRHPELASHKPERMTFQHGGRYGNAGHRRHCRALETYKKDQSNQELRNILIERYLPLVRYNAERVWAKLPEGVDLNDLISAGVFGLMDAIDAFDLGRGVKFETYCVPRIRGAMLDELRTMDWVPRLVRSKASKLESARKEAEAEFGRPPSDTEMAARLRLPLPEYEKLKCEASAVNLVSLNKKWYETDSYKDVREVDILEDSKGEDPTRGIQKRDLMKLVTKGLNRNERLIIILYYYEELTMKEIGNTLGLSESRVSQMHSSIVARLKDQLRRRRPEFD